ncbi:hypothetical protein LCGC14_0624440 [marine sediment metagenome]|uniref:Uncharacterized protein n=1 Tax=marine sediment metagenome TaxID=412755 RepID=A0A0F9UCF8_9ZZZZ
MILSTKLLNRVPASVLTRSVPVLDEEGKIVSTDTPEATYCWEFIDAAGTRMYVNADDMLDPSMLSPGEGQIVGTLAKVDPRDGAYKYAGPESPYPIRETWMVTALPLLRNARKV